MSAFALDGHRWDDATRDGAGQLATFLTKQLGFSDEQIAEVLATAYDVVGLSAEHVQKARS